MREVEVFKAPGGETIVDVTIVDIGRDVSALADDARRTGINIIAGCGNYIFSAFPEGLIHRTENAIYEEKRSATASGTPKYGQGSSVRSVRAIRSARRRKRCCARPPAPRLTRACQSQSMCMPPDGAGTRCSTSCSVQGVKSHKIILGHIDASLAHLDIDFYGAMDYILSLAARGCYVEFDLCGNSGHFITKDHSYWMPSDRERAKALKVLCDKGYGERLLLSQDVGHKNYLLEYGGWGYAHVLTDFTNTMHEAGLDDAAISRFFIVNPARVLAVDA